jgi:hypothetical protein
MMAGVLDYNYCYLLRRIGHFQLVPVHLLIHQGDDDGKTIITIYFIMKNAINYSPNNTMEWYQIIAYGHS